MERAAGKLGESMIRTISRHPKYFRRIVREAGIDTMTEAAIEDARVRGLEPERHFVVRGTEDFSLGQALKLALTPARYIKDMCWELAVRAGPEQFLTGDVPVTWRNPHARPPFGAGLGVRGTEVSFPISPNICLLAARVGAEGVRDVPADVVCDLNRERVRHAARFVFA